MTYLTLDELEEKTENKPFEPRWAYVLLGAMHFFGILGLSYPPLRPIFESMIPIHLMSSFFLLIHVSPLFPIKFYVALVVVGFFGYLAELIGVKSGIIFGDYFYVTNLGPHFYNVPILIGLNWILLSFPTLYVVKKYLPKQKTVVQLALGALIMVLIDVLIEPFAIEHEMWAWVNDTPPLHNYLGWFAVAFGILAFMNRFFPKHNNFFAVFLLVNQILFFGIHYLVHLFI